MVWETNDDECDQVGLVHELERSFSYSFDSMRFSRRAATGSAWTDSASIVIFGGIIVMRKRKKGKRFFPTEVLLFKS